MKAVSPLVLRSRQVCSAPIFYFLKIGQFYGTLIPCHDVGLNLIKKDMKSYLGIDISKGSFVVAYPSSVKEGAYDLRTFQNTEEGIAQFQATVLPHHHCVLEATGTYSMGLTDALCEAGTDTSVLNPKQSHGFAQMMMMTVKTDAKDAKMLARYGAQLNPPLYKLPNRIILILKQKRQTLRQLTKQKVVWQNVDHAMEFMPELDTQCQAVRERMIKVLEQEMAALKTEMYQITKEAHEHLMDKIMTVNGVGKATALALIVCTGGFKNFENAKQLSKFLGLCPTFQQSGTSIRKYGQITRSGDPNARAMLYMASLNAIQYNHACKELYYRLRRNGKPAKLALVAVMNKLVKQIFAVVKSDKDFDNTLYEKIHTQKS